MQFEIEISKSGRFETLLSASSEVIVDHLINITITKMSIHLLLKNRMNNCQDHKRNYSLDLHLQKIQQHLVHELKAIKIM